MNTMLERIAATQHPSLLALGLVLLFFGVTFGIAWIGASLTDRKRATVRSRRAAEAAIRTLTS